MKWAERPNPGDCCQIEPVSWRGTLTTVHTGLIGFDVGTGGCAVRPELLRLAKRGNQLSGNDRELLAA